MCIRDRYNNSGFIHMHSGNGRKLWHLIADSGGELGFDIAVFSSCSTRVAACNTWADEARVHIADVESAQCLVHRMTMRVHALVFDLSGQRLITVHSSSICIMDSASGARLHETQFLDSRLRIQAVSQPKEISEDD